MCPQCNKKHQGVDKGKCRMADRILKRAAQNGDEADRTHRAAALKVLGLDNKPDEQCLQSKGISCCAAYASYDRWDRRIKVLLSARRPGKVHTFIDTASQGHVVVSEAGVLHQTGLKLKLQGVTGTTSFADEVEIALQAPTLGCFEHVFQPCSPSMFTQASADNILLHALLKQQGYQIDFAEGRDGDPTFGGTIITPDGEKINM
eukprot:25985-Rhodomonas_salina.1